MGHGRVAVVTGAAQGIGYVIAERLGGEGFRVMLVDVNGTALKDAATRLATTGISFECHRADISQERDVKAFFDRTIGEFKKVDLLINNAAVSPKDKNNRRVASLDIGEDDWDFVMGVNLKGAFLCAKHAAKAMVDAGGGKIINIASIMGKIGGPGKEDDTFPPYSNSATHYSVSKAGVICMTRCLAREFARDKILVNAVAPGAVVSGMGKFDASLMSKIERQIPIGRCSTPNEIADAVLFLASDLASSITGETINVNGGWVMD